jgi:hypothetical protein
MCPNGTPAVRGNGTRPHSRAFIGSVRFLVSLPLAALTPQLLGAQSFVAADLHRIAVSPNRDDVKSIGMGNTQVADGRTFNAMEYNPALLATSRTTFDVIRVQASLPLNSFDALAFLRDNRDQFNPSTGFFSSMYNGARTYLSPGATAEQKAAAVQQVNAGLAFVNQFQQKVLGPPDDPRTQGFAVIPDIQVQAGNLGFSLHGTLRSALTTYPGEALTRMYTLGLPADIRNASTDQLIALAGIIGPLIDPVSHGLRYGSAMPQTFAVAYIDIVGTAGYGYRLSPEISLGANLKILNRRISTRGINSDNYSSIMTELRKDFDVSFTGVTMDLGALYHLKTTGTDIGLSVQNVIPLRGVRSTASFNSVVYDSAMNPRTVSVDVPVEFNVPVLINLGVTHPLMKNWDSSLDVVDIAAQDEKHVNFGGRIRLGTEYRLEAIPGSLGIAFRGGLAERKLAGGVGLNLFRVVQIDGAYGWDYYVDDYAVFAQLRFGW